MTSDDNDAAIVRSIIDLARNLHLRVVAEGVEDAPSLAALRELGCDTVQGYYLSRPVPAASLTTTFATHGTYLSRWIPGWDEPLGHDPEARTRSC